MDKRSDQRLRRKQLRLKYGVFLRKNGLFAALALCLAVIGGVAALMFAGGSDKGNSPAEHNYDERLDNVIKASTQPVTTPGAIVLPSAKTPTERPAKTAEAYLPQTPTPTLAPDFTPAPSVQPTEPVENVTFTAPVDGSVIRIFAMDCLIYSKTLDQWMTHPGVDVAAPKGSEVRTVAAGTVERVYTDDMLGVTVVIAHQNGMRTVYANLKAQPPVAEGQQVESRAVIGFIGDTAISECSEQAHLHFELYVNDTVTDPTAYVMFPSMPE